MNINLNFNIGREGEISSLFIQRGIHDFESAVSYIRRLPYGRNAHKNALRTVFSDNRGTCSTKHALLKTLASEHGIQNVELVLGIFKMNGRNTPPVSDILLLNNLPYIPEAHNYLKIDGQILDCTRANSSEHDFIHDLLEEIVIEPGQITGYKVDYHKNYLDKWLSRQKNIRMNLNELWDIREQCIQVLSH